MKAAALCGWMEAGRPKSAVPVRVNVIAYRSRAIDSDNLLACCKWLLDRILCANRHLDEGVVPDDSPEWVSIGEIRQVTGKQWLGKEQVVLEIWPREATEEQ